LKVTLNSEATDQKCNIKGTADYKNDKITSTLVASYPVKADGKPVLSGAISAVLFDKYIAGALVEHRFDGARPSQLQLRLQYSGNKHSLLGYYNHAFGGSDKKGDKQTVGLTYFHALRSDIDFVTDISMNPMEFDQPNIRLGAAWRNSSDSTVKFRVDLNDKPKLFFSHTQKLGNNASFTFGLQHDLNNLSSSSSAFGFKLKVTF